MTKPTLRPNRRLHDALKRCPGALGPPQPRRFNAPDRDAGRALSGNLRGHGPTMTVVAEHDMLPLHAQAQPKAACSSLGRAYGPMGPANCTTPARTYARKHVVRMKTAIPSFLRGSAKPMFYPRPEPGNGTFFFSVAGDARRPPFLAWLRARNGTFCLPRHVGADSWGPKAAGPLEDPCQGLEGVAERAVKGGVKRCQLADYPLHRVLKGLRRWICQHVAYMSVEAASRRLALKADGPQRCMGIRQL